MTFLRNCWYVAGWSADFVAGSLHGMRIAGEPVVLFRRADGTLAALLDRCPHRWAPLSMGRVEGDGLRCMYHGIRFGGDGQCLEVPEQKGAPAALTVRSYPVVERHHWAWVWTGEPAAADPALISDMSAHLAVDGMRQRFGSLDYAANYLGICDNLLDLSHVAFLHENTLAGGATQTDFKARVAEIEDGVRVSYWKKGGAAGSASRRPDGVLTDVFNSYDFVLPGIFKLRSRAFPAGTADSLDEGVPPEDLPALIDDRSGQAVTPTGAGTSRYFYSFGQRGDGPEARLDGIWSVVGAAFEEDRRMIEAQQRMIDDCPGERMGGSAADRGVALFRRIVERALDREQADRTAPDRAAAA